MPSAKEIGHQVRFSNTLIGLFKKGWWFIPEIMASSGLALVGMGFAIVGCNNYIKNDGDNREYKKVYVIMRPDDPRVPRLNNPVCTSYPG